MSLISMTGYGRGEAAGSGVKVEAELSSVNRKQFDLRLNLPRQMAALEAQAYELIHKSVSRGHVQGVVKLSLASEARAQRVVLDTDMARAYVKGLRDAAAELGLDDDLSATSLLRLPEVLQCESAPEESDNTWPLVRQALAAAVSALVEMRKAEGAALEKDLRKRLARAQKLSARIAKRAGGVKDAYQQALRKRLAEAGVECGPDDPQLLRELVLFAEKSDISEELVRLDSHFAYAEQLLASAKPVGRPLDFLCQELYREINTIGSKANDGTVSRLVVEFKAELEALREQVQNVE